MAKEQYRKLTPIECFKWSLHLGVDRQRRADASCFLREFFVSAPVWELRDEKIPQQMDLLYDLPRNESYERIWLDLWFDRVVRVNGELRAVYSVIVNC